MLKFNLDELEGYIQAGLLRKTKHPDLDLFLWKYSEKCQYEKAWTPTLRQMRGVVLDGEGNRVTRPFDKFFNFTKLGNEELFDDLNQSVSIYENYQILSKLDGSLITVTNNQKYGLIVTSSGSFESVHVGWAKELLETKYPLVHFPYNQTYCLELIHPENRIVVNYGKRKELVLLSVNSVESGVEMRYSDMVGLGLPVVGRDFRPIGEILKEVDDPFKNEEGFVFRFQHKPFLKPYRIKLKLSEYVILHKSFTDISNRTIWKALAHGMSVVETLDNIPDEMMASVRAVELDLKHQFDKLMWKVYAAFTQTQVEGLEDRKAFALYVLKEYKDLAPMLFCLRDGHDQKARDLVWKSIYPEKAQKLWGVQEDAQI